MKVCGITAESSIARGIQVLKLNVLCLAQKNDFNIRNGSVDGRETFLYLWPLTDAFRLNVHWAEERLCLCLLVDVIMFCCVLCCEGKRSLQKSSTLQYLMYSEIRISLKNKLIFRSLMFIFCNQNCKRIKGI